MRGKALFFLPFFLFLGSSLVNGANATVSTFDELEKKVEMALPGDIITLEKGEYAGQLVITKQITLKGMEGARLIAPPTGYPIVIEADGVIIDNLEIEGGGSQNAGIYIKSNNTKIRNNTIQDVFHGIYIKNGYGNEISKNSITSFRNPNLHKGYGVYTVEAPQTMIFDNYFNDLQDGVFVSYSDFAEVSNNLIENARYGIHTMDSKNVVITKNEVRKSHNGLMIMQSANLFITQNVLHLNTTVDGAGMFVFDTFDSLISVNLMKGNFKGIFFENSQRNTIEFNEFLQNDIGFDLGKGSDDNVIYLNNFTQNTKQMVTSTGNQNKLSRDGFGNYWDDLRSINMNEDNFVDFPYKSGDIFFNMTSKEPLLQVFFQSPTVYLWNKIEQFTPIPAEHFIIDKFPLASAAPIDLSFIKVNETKVNTEYSARQILLFGSIVFCSGMLLWTSRRKNHEV